MSLHAAAREKEALRISVNIPTEATADILSLDLRCTDKTGRLIIEHTVRLDLPEIRRNSWLKSLTDTGPLKVNETEAEIKIESPRWVLTLTRSSGTLTIRDRSGHLLLAGINPHSGRRLTYSEQAQARKINTWRASTLSKFDAPEIRMTQQDGAVRLTVSGRYPRPDALEQAFVGGYQAEITPRGTIALSYDYAPTNAKGVLAEAGLSLVLPSEMTEFRWIGQGPYAGYPGKDRLNQFGTFHLNREDLLFQGNRRETEIALLTTSSGIGVALSTTAADVSVERDGDKVLLSHNAVISGLGNKGGWPSETLVEAAKTPHITGSFTLVPLDATWPAALTQWFGKPVAAREVFRPFYLSYDQ